MAARGSIDHRADGDPEREGKQRARDQSCADEGHSRQAGGHRRTAVPADRREEPKRGGSRAVRCDATEIGLAQTRKTSIMAPTSP
jgi:hypothetical protein